MLEERIGYRFKDRYLLECALTHTSFANEQKIQTLKDYERIEFLGDAVLEMISSEFLYRTYPDKKEGELTTVQEILLWVPLSASEEVRKPAEEGKRIRSPLMLWRL